MCGYLNPARLRPAMILLKSACNRPSTDSFCFLRYVDSKHALDLNAFRLSVANSLCTLLVVKLIRVLLKTKNTLQSLEKQNFLRAPLNALLSATPLKSFKRGGEARS